MSVYEIMEHELHGNKGTSLKGLVHTSLQRRSETSIALVFHDTDVVTAYSNGTVMLDDGGWHENWRHELVELTPTTKKRIALYLPGGWDISQVKYKWIVYGPNGQYEYERYMVIHPDTDTVEYKSGKQVQEVSK